MLIADDDDHEIEFQDEERQFDISNAPMQPELSSDYAEDEDIAAAASDVTQSDFVLLPLVQELVSAHEQGDGARKRSSRAA